MDKGSLSNILSAVAMVAGYVLARSGVPGGELLLSAGLFAFSGGITNSIAVKMLFDRVPGLYGSGVILDRFEEIRAQIRHLILDQFFTVEQIRRFLEESRAEIDWTRYVEVDGERRGAGPTPVETFVEVHWERFASQESLGPVIRTQVDKLLGTPMGGLLGIVGRGTIEGMVGGFVHSFATEVKGRVLEAGRRFQIDPSTLPIRWNVPAIAGDVRAKVDRLLSERLAEMRPEDVKRMIEDVIRKHLGWLVVWGNVFGALIGIASYFIA
jgi:hypothetical protein